MLPWRSNNPTNRMSAFNPRPSILDFYWLKLLSITDLTHISVMWQDVFVILLPPWAFQLCHVDVKILHSKHLGLKSSAALLTILVGFVITPGCCQESWLIPKGRLCFPSSMTGPTASLPAAAIMDIRQSRRVCPLFGYGPSQGETDIV